MKQKSTECSTDRISARTRGVHVACGWVAVALVLLLNGCGESNDQARASLAQEEIRSNAPAGWVIGDIRLDPFEEMNIQGRSEARFQADVTPVVPMGVLIETIDGTAIVTPVLDVQADDEPDSTNQATLFGTVRITRARDDSSKFDIRVGFDRGTITAFDQRADKLRPMASFGPYVLEGSEAAGELRSTFRQRELEEATHTEAMRAAALQAQENATLEADRVRSDARIAAARLREREILERERIETDGRIERERLARLSLDDLPNEHWIDANNFATAGTNMGEPIHAELVVNATPAQAFDTFSTSAGIKAALDVESRIELRIGGAYEWYLAPDAPVGDRGGEGYRILAYEPNRLLIVSWSAPPNFPAERAQRNWVIFRFEPLDPAEDGSVQTRISITHTGFGTGRNWNSVRDYFVKAWPKVLSAVANHLDSDG